MKYLLVAALLIGGNAYADTLRFNSNSFLNKLEREQDKQQQRNRDFQRQMEDKYRREQQQAAERRYRAEQERHRLEYHD